MQWHFVKVVLYVCLQLIGEIFLGGSVQAMDCYDYGKQFAVGGMSTQLKLAKMIWSKSAEIDLNIMDWQREKDIKTKSVTHFLVLCTPPFVYSSISNYGDEISFLPSCLHIVVKIFV